MKPDELECTDACRATEGVDRKTLRTVLAINLAQSLGGGVVGVLASSAGLIGAAVDNLADAGVYGLSLFAVGGSAARKARAARVSGAILILLSLLLVIEVLRRFFAGAEPIGPAMMAAAAINAGLNLVCLRLLRAHRGQGVHFDASWIFTSNDTLVNLGIVASGLLVMVLGSPIPDLVIGVVTAAVAAKGGMEILEMAQEARHGDDAPR
ncbi:cation transporter [Sinimarinibacterium sp. HSW-8]|uniref:Cation transporter n=1 Tax=Sinimarinibacterium thermocellulolyticum TaxID=3170016 RepID=A0ABV2AEU9_9GAMM